MISLGATLRIECTLTSRSKNSLSTWLISLAITGFIKFQAVASAWLKATSTEKGPLVKSSFHGFLNSFGLNILYVFYWGEIEGYEKLSPIAFLSQKLIKHAKEKKFKLLDIGTSSVNSNPNIGLLKFKKSIGCISCNKLYLTKSY